MSKDTLLATALRVLRETRSLTQKELAEASGIERNTISKYENGWIQPSREKLRALLDALGFGYSELEEAEQFVQRMRLGAEGAALAGVPAPARGELLAPGPRGRQIRQASEELGRYLGVLLELVAARPGNGGGGGGGGGGDDDEGGG